MSFWGVEVKPGKPYIHRRDDVKRRLHISQATLGNGTAKEKSLVQCNVGATCPVFLCSLFPLTSESCQLNLEFDELESVVFSVVGPRSVHLTGYFVAIGRGNALCEESESFGEDIAQSESERFTESEDDYDGSFIDDGEPEAMSLSSEGGDDEVLDTKKLMNRNQGRRRLKKKYELSESDDQGSPQKNSNVKDSASASDSEADDWFTISSLAKKESTKLKGLETKAKPCSSKNKTDIEAGAGVFSDNKRESNLQSDLPIAEVTVDAKDSSKLERNKEHLEDADDKSAAVLKDEGTMDGKNPAKRKLDAEDSSKPKKRKKRHLEEGGGNTSDGLKDEKVLNDEDQTKVSSDNDGNICIEKLPKAKKNKKKKNKENKAKGNVATLAEEVKEVDNAYPRISEIKTMSNGVSFEEKELGIADGKIAAPGKKIKIKYVGMLKDNGQMFESKTGHDSLKFRLGSDDIIDGLNVGLDGMRVGGKRRLVIPPSMGYGSEGLGSKVPPDSWLEYDVELISVR